MKASAYHVLLRVSALTLALILLFDSGILLLATKEFSLNTQQYLAGAFGASASVEPTELNTLTAQISARERELDDREASIASRELSIGLTVGENQDSNPSTYLLSVILFIIVVLMVLNYALDFARERRLMYLQQNEQTT
jgi:hypothetical protein